MNNFSKIIIGILVIVILFFMISYKLKDNEVNRLTEENGKLSDDLKAKVKVETKTNTVYVTTRVAGKVVTKIIKVPRGGEVTTVIDNNGNSTTNVPSVVFPFMPNMSVQIGDETQPALGIRYISVGRYGSSINAGTKGANISIDRSIEDFVPFLPNTDVGVFYGWKYDSRPYWGLKLSSYL
jgi:hypothetical protein